MNSLVIAALLLLGTGVPQAEQRPKASMPGVTNYTRVDATTGTGGATTVEAYPALKKAGYVAVINLRLANEPGVNIDEAKAAASAAGLKYLHVPVGGSPTAESVQAVLAAVQDQANLPVYIHCASANRVGAVWLIKRVLVDKVEMEAAVAEAKRIGLRSPELEQFAREYIAAHAG